MYNKNLQITNHDFLIYRDSNNDVKVSVMLINNDIWLTQNLIAELFGVGRSTITEHINNILNSGELDENNTVGKTDVDNFLNETRMIENGSENNGYVSKKRNEKE